MNSCSHTLFKNATPYRYGFQGQEKDDEVSGAGNSYTAEFWEYSPRLGKRWNIDPVVKHWESPYACFSNNPILLRDPNGADVINGDRQVADGKKSAMETSNKSLTDFKSSHSINDNTKKKDFLANGGSKSDWKTFKGLKKESATATKEFKTWDARANETQAIIDKWKTTSPNIFNEVDKQDVDFVLHSFDFKEGAFGSTTPAYVGEPSNAGPPKQMRIKIASEVNLDSPDYQTGEYSLNHEAGHFLYIVKFTAEYVRYYVESKRNGTYVNGGHGTTDESGKVATKYGGIKDNPVPAPEIKVTGN